jgi:hypothetical protein
MHNQLISRFQILSWFTVPILLFFLTGCEKSHILVYPEEDNNEIYLLSYSSKSIKTINPSFDTVQYLADSSLSINYQKLEDIGTNVLDIVELFSTTLFHRLSSNTTLDYGNVVFAGQNANVNVSVNANSDRSWVTYYYSSTATNNKYDSSAILWLNVFRLQNKLSLFCYNSPRIKDVNLIIPTKVPNEILSPITGNEISTTSDLEIVFQRELSRGSIISLGFGLHYINIEIINPLTRVKISQKDIQKVKELLQTENTMICHIGFVEGICLGVIEAIDRKTLQKYQLPIFQFTRGWKTVYLKK